MNIPFNDLKRAFDRRQAAYEAALADALRSGYYVLGNRVGEFESSFARYIGMRYGIGVNSGQDALILAVRALGIGPGDEVIVQANAYIASVLGITENGATPIFVEPDEYFGIDCSKIEAAITERTKAILPVHLYGQPCDMECVSRIAKSMAFLWWRTAPNATVRCKTASRLELSATSRALASIPLSPWGRLAMGECA